MSEENVALVRRVIGLWNQGDLDAALELAADDVEMDWSNSIGPAMGTYRGKDGFREFWTSFAEVFDVIRLETQETIDVDESQVIVVNQFRSRGRGSGIEVNATGAQLWTISEGRWRRVKLYQSKAKALEAAGVQE